MAGKVSDVWYDREARLSSRCTFEDKDGYFTGDRDTISVMDIASTCDGNVIGVLASRDVSELTEQPLEVALTSKQPALMNITVLAGGVGAARFLEGVVQVVPQRDVTVISNTGDDEDFFGLRVSPDIDIVIYTLAGAVDAEKGWGLAGETFHALEALAPLRLRDVVQPRRRRPGDARAPHAAAARRRDAVRSDAHRSSTAFGLRTDAAAGLRRPHPHDRRDRRRHARRSRSTS